MNSEKCFVIKTVASPPQLTYAWETFDIYLDIETTGLSIVDDYITVIGLYLIGINNSFIIQLIDEGICEASLANLMKNIKNIYTYNGKKFDIPFIKRHLNFNFAKIAPHTDLMVICHKAGLYGGFKRVEQVLGIERKLADVDGKLAAQLSYRYKYFNDKEALATLLEYNKEDLLNLYRLKLKLSLLPYTGLQ